MNIQQALDLWSIVFVEADTLAPKPKPPKSHMLKQLLKRVKTTTAHEVNA